MLLTGVLTVMICSYGGTAESKLYSDLSVSAA